MIATGVITIRVSDKRHYHIQYDARYFHSMKRGMEPKKDRSLAVREGFVLPRIIADEGRRAQNAFINFFTATIENTNTRRAYARAVRDFFSFIEERRASTTLHEIEPFMIAGFIKQLPSSPRSKQQYVSAPDVVRISRRKRCALWQSGLRCKTATLQRDGRHNEGSLPHPGAHALGFDRHRNGCRST